MQYITLKTKDSWIGENEMPKDVLVVDAYNNNVAAVFSEEDNVTLSFGEQALRVYKVATES